MKHGKKRKKSRFVDFEKKRKKRKKRRSNNIWVYRPEDYGDHPQSVLLSFTQLPRSYVGPILINNEQF